MANSPSDASGHDSGIAFQGHDTPGDTSGTPGIRKDISPYDEDVSSPTSMQSQDGFRSKAYKADAEQINRTRTGE